MSFQKRNDLHTQKLSTAMFNHIRSCYTEIDRLSSLSPDSRVAQLEKTLIDVKELLRQIEHRETDAVIDAEVLARQARYEIEESFGFEDCPACLGKQGPGHEFCDPCGGTGQRLKFLTTPAPVKDGGVACPECDGVTLVGDCTCGAGIHCNYGMHSHMCPVKICSACDGSGKLPHPDSAQTAAPNKTEEA